MSRPYCKLCGLRKHPAVMATKGRCIACKENLVHMRLIHAINKDHDIYLKDNARQERIRVYTERATARVPLFPGARWDREAA